VRSARRRKPMNTRKLSRLVPALVLGLLAGAVAAQQPEPGSKPPAPAAPAAPAKATPAPAKASPGAPARGSEVVGSKIVDASDKKLAKIEDLVIQDSGEVTAVVERESGGLVCVPLSALQPKLKKHDADKDGQPTAEVDVFVYTADAAKLAAAETIANAEAIDATALARCRDYFAGKTAGSSTEPAAKPEEGRGADKPAAMVSGAKPWCVKKLVGTNIKDSAGEGLGEVKDVAVDLGRGQLAYVVISAGGVMGVGDKLHGVALNRFTRSADGKDLTLPLTQDSLKSVKGFDIDHLPMTPDLSVGATGDLVTPSSTDSNS
jgi:sporulation protein YlmC with PRC-barrel domain